MAAPYIFDTLSRAATMVGQSRLLLQRNDELVEQSKELIRRSREAMNRSRTALAGGTMPDNDRGSQGLGPKSDSSGRR